VVCLRTEEMLGVDENRGSHENCLKELASSDCGALWLLCQASLQVELAVLWSIK
jgi:hypothetical protein